MHRLRLGVVGVGHLGQHHARVLASMDDVLLVGVADSRPDQGRAVADRCGTTWFADWREMLDQVDAVSVAVPTSAHREVAGEFLRRGLSAMVEKPLAIDSIEGAELVELARTSGATLQVGHIERFNPTLSALDGLDLRPKYIAAERLGTYTFRSTDIGVVHDLMIHDLDLILSLIAAPVRSVEAVGVSLFGTLEDVANARIEFEDGAVANITASRASYQAVRKMRLYGPEGYATLDFGARQATIVRPSEALLRGDLQLEGVDLSSPPAVKDHVFGTVLQPESIQCSGREPLALELEDFVRSIRARTAPIVSGEIALRAMRLADQVVDSINRHAWEGSARGPIGPRGFHGGDPAGSVPPRPKFLTSRVGRKDAVNEQA
ncbi:Gfo/Idh/MocA family oxidoreductase [Isosphaeraceae bacterium EP7]